MRDPIDRLLDEHRAIMARVGELRRAVADLSRRGERALPDALPTLAAVSLMMGTDLLAHARREDEVLFPALEAFFGTTASPTAVMREEHRAIHGNADLFRKTLHELNDVEHPAIVTGGEKLRTLAARGGTADALRVTAETVIDLLDLHFAKEEDILFPMARQVLSPAEMREIDGRMEALDAE